MADENASTSALTDETFDEIINSATTPVLVDFWAPWCGPCKMLGPIIEEVAEEIKGKAVIYKVNVDDNPNISGKFGIMSIPTVMLFVGGEVKETMVGVQGKETYIDVIERYS